MTRQFTYGLLCCLLVLLCAGCSDDPEGPTVPDDTTAPSDVIDLSAAVEGDSSIVLTWTAPGGDGSAGRASAYDVRYSTSAINLQNWDAAVHVQGEPAPKEPGEQERFNVPGVVPDTSYYFRLKTLDRAANASGLSNPALADATPPTAINDLIVLEQTTRSVTLWWTEPWDNGITARASSYEIRYSAQAITDQNWSSAAEAPSPPIPGPPGSHATYRLSGLQPDTLVYVGVRSWDDAGNLSALSNILPAATLAGGWVSFGSDFPNDAVSVLLPVNGNLVAGGSFTLVGTEPANRIAAWNGQAWAAMGEGFSGGAGGTEVRALTFYGSELVAGGAFGSSGIVVTKAIARWDGFAWQPVGTGIDGHLLAVASQGSNLYAGGIFQKAGGQDIEACARWDGSRWNSMRLHWPALGVAALTFYNGDLVAGGSFTYASATLANHIAGWDGSNWYAFGTGFSGASPVNCVALTVYDGDLIAGGRFQQAGGTSANKIAGWDGSSWYALNQGLGDDPDNDYIGDMIEYNGSLIVGGRFTVAGGHSAFNIARWDGSAWHSMGQGIDNGGGRGVMALAVWNGSLYVGGHFVGAGGEPAPNIARWED